MENKAAPQLSAVYGLRVVAIAALAGVMTMLACFAGSASAKGKGPVAGDGKIHACYRVKGKPKGVVRVVRGKSHRCRRGERRMAWFAAAGPGVPGATGAQGQSGAGSSTAGAAEENDALKAQIGDMTLRIAALEGVLKGITNGDLTGVLGTLDGVTNGELLDAIESTALVGEVCDQTEALTSQVNVLGDEFEDLITTLTGTLLGAIFGGIEVPLPLDESLTCPTP